MRRDACAASMRCERMKVSEAVERRISVRAFLPDPVPREVLERALTRASRAPSGGNLQPWLVSVLTGDALARFLRLVSARIDAGEIDRTEYDVYPPNLHEPYRTRRFKVGEDMYEKFGIAEMEVTDEVFESPAGIQFEQAENRMHTIKAILVATLAG